MPNRRLSDRFEGPQVWTDEVTVIAAGLSAAGWLDASGDVIVGGVFDGTIATPGLVRIMPGAVVRGPVEAGSALVEGTIEGDITVADQLEAGPTARIGGTVRGPVIALAERADVRGKVETGGPPVIRFTERRSR